MQPGDVPVTYADTEPLERDFGFKPHTPLREGLHIHAGSTGKIHINISQTPIWQTINLMCQRRNLHSHTVQLGRQAGADAGVNAYRFVPHIGKLYFFNPLYLLFRHIDLRWLAYKE